MMFKSWQLLLHLCPHLPLGVLDWSVPAPLATLRLPREASLRPLHLPLYLENLPFPQVITRLASSAPDLYANVSFSVGDFLTTLFKNVNKPNPDTSYSSSLLYFSTAAHHYLMYDFTYLICLQALFLLQILNSLRVRNLGSLFSVVPGTPWHSKYIEYTNKTMALIIQNLLLGFFQCLGDS